jgi:hypothetical protein
MSGCYPLCYSYYGVINDEKPLRPLAEDIVREFKEYMMQEMREMEERIKRHITECKREVIKEFILFKPKEKEIKNVGNGKRKISKSK